MIKVAICEDSRMDRELLRKIVTYLMQERGLVFQLGIFESGEALMQDYEKHPFDLIFLDIMMNGLDGLKTGKETGKVMYRQKLFIAPQVKILQLQHMKSMRWVIY